MSDRDQDDVETWPPEGVDPREVELERAGVVFTRQEGRDAYRRQLRDARIDGYDDHHKVCKALVDDVRAELLHEMRSQAQAYELRFAALEQRSQPPGGEHAA